MAFQRPVAIPGVKLADFLRHATTTVRNPERKEGEELLPMREFRKELRSKMEHLRMDTEFARRYVNDGFSGGEMKRAEILQLAMLQPKFAVLDETDSGLDVDALKIVAEGVNRLRDARYQKSEIGSDVLSLSSSFSALIVTHYARILEYITPDYVHVMVKGRIVESGDASFAKQLEKEGYEKYVDHKKVKLEV